MKPKTAVILYGWELSWKMFDIKLIKISQQIKFQ